MISEAKEEIAVLGSEKDYLRLYHSDFLDDFSNPKNVNQKSSHLVQKKQCIFLIISKNLK